MAWVYILHADRRYYIGATENLERRLEQHRRGSNHTTRRFGFQPVLVAAKELPSMPEALVLERQLKQEKGPRLAILALNAESKVPR
ncbi:MAG TPA: GIY-YIG nuclease family protein [Chthoniobacterales bacterium]